MAITFWSPVRRAAGARSGMQLPSCFYDCGQRDEGGADFQRRRSWVQSAPLCPMDSGCAKSLAAWDSKRVCKPLYNTRLELEQPANLHVVVDDVQIDRGDAHIRVSCGIAHFG